MFFHCYTYKMQWHGNDSSRYGVVEMENIHAAALLPTQQLYIPDGTVNVLPASAKLNKLQFPRGVPRCNRLPQSRCLPKTCLPAPISGDDKAS